MRQATKAIAASIVQLNAIPAERRDNPDYRTARGLLQEAAGYIKAGDDTMALRLHEAALPYLRFAELH